MYTLASSPEWELTLVEFLNAIGVQTTHKQLWIIDHWLQKHNKRLHTAAVDLERANSKARRAFISQN